MKRLSLLIFFILFSGILYLSENDLVPYLLNSEQDSSYYFNGILKSELPKLEQIANYNIDVEFNPAQKLINVKEIITWINKTNYSTNEILFHFYPNAYKSNRTLFANAYKITSDAKTEIQIRNFNIDGKTYELFYFQPEIPNPHDSTVAKVILNKTINPNDTVKIYFDYSMKIPRSVKRMGYATGRNFFFVSQWFPKIGVFENGEWICSQYHPYLNFYSDFGEYNVNIEVPKNYIVGATGVLKQKLIDGQNSVYKISQAGVHDFAWFATDEILIKKDFYKRKDGSQIFIYTYVQPERKKYSDRYINCIKNCLEFFENNIGIYPYQNITLVDVPRTSASGGMEYPTLFTVSADLFSPIKTGWPEYLVAHEFAHQYFQGIIANNEVYEAWLDEGFASYISTKIMYKYYPNILENFKIISYIPIFGLNFLSYNEIPIIYTIADIPISEGVLSAKDYYRNMLLGSIADTSYKLPSRLSYIVNSYNKPELMLLSLERYIGFNRMMKVLRSYYDNYKYKHPTSKNFFDEVQKNFSEDLNWFFKEFYYNTKVFDYKISSIKKISNNVYQVFAERLGDGIFKNDIALYTDKDTLYLRWDGKERWKVFTFVTNNNVIAAEIDPFRKNLLDINIANNSYTLEPRYWASISIALRWFFWVQNALMILGSIG